MTAAANSNRPQTLMQALLAVQAKVSSLNLAKEAENPTFKSKYLTLGKLMDEVLPLLNENGLIWLTMPGQDDEGNPVLHYELQNAGNPNLQSADGTPAAEAIRGMMPLLLDKQNSQGLGSALTYARRQSVMAILGAVGDDDDDGAAASTTEVEKPSARKSRKLTEDELAKVIKAIHDSGKKIDLVLSAIGAEDKDNLTVADSRQIKKLLELS